MSYKNGTQHRKSNSADLHSNVDFVRIDPRDGVTVLTLEKSQSLGKKLGFCYRCGQKTHTLRPPFGKKPITNATVLKGKCLKCEPDMDSSASVVSTSTKSSASSAQSFSTEGSATRPSQSRSENAISCPVTPERDPARPRSEPRRTYKFSQSLPEPNLLSRSGRTKDFSTPPIRRSLQPNMVNPHQPSTPPRTPPKTPSIASTPTSAGSPTTPITPMPIGTNSALATKLGLNRHKATGPGVVRVVEEHHHSVSSYNNMNSSSSSWADENYAGIDNNNSSNSVLHHPSSSPQTPSIPSTPTPPMKNPKKIGHRRLNATTPGVVHVSEKDEAPYHRVSAYNNIDEHSLSDSAPNLDLPRLQVSSSVREPSFGNYGEPQSSTTANHINSFESILTTLNENLTDTVIVQEACQSLQSLSPPKGCSFKSRGISITDLYQTLLLVMQVHGGESGLPFNSVIQINSLDILERMTCTREVDCTHLGKEIMKNAMTVMDASIASSSGVERNSIGELAVGVLSNLLAMANEDNNTDLQYKAVAILSHLCGSHPLEQHLTAELGVPAVVTAMTKNKKIPKIQQCGCKILSRLASSESSEMKQCIMNIGGIDAIISAMFKCGDDASLQRKACSALAGLCYNDDARSAIVSNSGIVAVADAMTKNVDSIELQGDGCVVLAFLSDGGLEVKFALDSADVLSITKKAMRKYPNDNRVQTNGRHVVALLSDLY